jgi:hypothetical protein
MSFETATPFQNQEELTEPERYYMNGLVKDGFEVRYDEERIYNARDGQVVSFGRIHLQKMAKDNESSDE